MIKITILGLGRMGKEVLRQCIAEGFKIVSVIEAPKSPLLGKDAGTLAGIEPLGIWVTNSEDLSETLDEDKPDVTIDFTNAHACVENSKLICERGINMVIGTTGFIESEMKELRENIEKYKTGAVISPNMSIGVNVFWEIVRRASELLKDYDIEIVEAHHRFKKDAPSGTALKTAEIISEKLGRDLKGTAIYGRRGMKERNPGEIGIHAIRAGDIVGEHTVIFGTLGERVEIIHRAHSRAAFAKGVVEAVKFIKDKRGIYGMDDVLGLK